MSDKLWRPEGAGELQAPPAAKQANEVRQRTLVPAVFLRDGWLPKDEFILEPESVTPTRYYHRTLHVMTKLAEQTLCHCKRPEGYPLLLGMSQEQNQKLMELDKHTPSWHRLVWCNFCTSYGGFLIGKRAA